MVIYHGFVVIHHNLQATTTPSRFGLDLVQIHLPVNAGERESGWCLVGGRADDLLSPAGFSRPGPPNPAQAAFFGIAGLERVWRHNSPICMMAHYFLMSTLAFCQPPSPSNFMSILVSFNALVMMMLLGYYTKNWLLKFEPQSLVANVSNIRTYGLCGFTKLQSFVKNGNKATALLSKSLFSFLSSK